MPRMARVAVIVCCLAGAAQAPAQTKQKSSREGAAPERKRSELTVEALQQRLKQIESAGNLDEETKKNLTETYTTALEHLKTAREHAARAAEFRKLTADAPRELEELKASLDAPPPDTPPKVTSEMGLAELQESLIQAEKEYEALQQRLDELQSEPKRR